jgi:hypothetical protein
MLPLFYPSIFITLLFFFSGFEKIHVFSQASAKFAKKLGLPLILGQIFYTGAIALELIAPAIIAAYTFTGMVSIVPYFKLAIMALMAFTTIVTLIYHNPFKSKEKYFAFMSNVSTFGGLMALYISV